VLTSLAVQFLRVTASDKGHTLVDKPLATEVSLRGHRCDEQNLVLFWQPHQPQGEDYATYVHFFGADLQCLGQADKEAMAEGFYIFPTSHWAVGQVVQDEFPPAPSTTAYVRGGTYTSDEDGIRDFGRAVLFQLRAPAIPEGARRLDVQLGEQVVLWGNNARRQDESLLLELYWTARAAVAGDYTVFVHLMDADGEGIVTQHDRQPLAGFHPTLLWRA
jgi:hypothetical protein